ncbi:MAG TPA: AsmA-like C-terminal region-containing protein [Verrucomicrobiae bacterium]|nr:AsmA-like C-terminal region-containing protein [Verrucomicrobiae bacterium]
MSQTGKIKRSLPRLIFRGFRIAALLAVLYFVLLVLWSNYFQVPNFISSRVKEELRRNNVTLDFERLRLRGFRRIVAEQLRIGLVRSANSPRVEIREAELRLRLSGWPRARLSISGLRLADAQLALPINDPGQALRLLSVTNVQAEVEFLAGDNLRITDLSGEVFGAKANASGLLRNFSRFRFAETGSATAARRWQGPLAEVADIVEQLQFATPPEISINFATDGADVSKSRALVNFRAEQASSRWGEFEMLRLSSGIFPVSSNATVNGLFTLDIESLRSDSAVAGLVHFGAETIWTADMQRLVTNHVTITATHMKTKWMSAEQLEAQLASAQTNSSAQIASRFTGSASKLAIGSLLVAESALSADLLHILPFSTPAALLNQVLSSSPRAPSHDTQEQRITGTWSIQSQRAVLPNAVIGSVLLSGGIASTGAASTADSALSLWRYLQPCSIPWQLQASNIAAQEVNIGTITAAGAWLFPELSATNIEARLYGGALHGTSELNVLTRVLALSAEAEFDYQRTALLLDPPAQRWLAQFGWAKPPLVQSRLSFVLPEWNDSWERLSRRVLAQMKIDGRFRGSGTFRGIPIDRASAQFHFANFTWTLPDLTLIRPEGQARVSYSGNVTNQDFSIRVESEIDPAILVPLFEKAQQSGIQMVKFAQPPHIEAEVWGNLENLEHIGARGTISTTNFFVKEQALTDVRADFSFTNSVIEVTNLLLHRGKEELRAPYLKIDLRNEVIWVTNAISTIDPYVAMSLVGDEAYKAIDPYRFANSPTVTVNGVVPLRHYSKANIHFGVAGTEFTYWKFHLPSVTGDVYWRSNDLSISNVVASFYNGQAQWSGHFLIDNKTDSADFSFRGLATNATLRPLVHDLFGGTNNLDGLFSGELVITSANTANDNSWDGYGKATLENGFLWSVPVFGLFSPVLDSIAPGLGSNPISSGAGNFTIKNSVIHTRDLQVRAPAFRLNYRGNVDLAGRLDARVEAEILRDAWVVGKLFSTALWPVSKAFEARVTGNLSEPKTKFRFVPKFVFAPLKLLGTLSEAVKQKEAQAKLKSNTPVPPAAPAESPKSEPALIPSK